MVAAYPRGSGLPRKTVPVPGLLAWAGVPTRPPHPGKPPLHSQLPSPGGPGPGSHAGKDQGSKGDGARVSGSGLGGPATPEAGGLTRGGRLADRASGCALQSQARERAGRAGAASLPRLGRGGSSVRQPSVAGRPAAHARTSWNSKEALGYQNPRSWRLRLGFTETSSRLLRRGHPSHPCP